MTPTDTQTTELYQWVKVWEDNKPNLPKEQGWYCIRNINPNGFIWFTGEYFIHQNEPIVLHHSVEWLEKLSLPAGRLWIEKSVEVDGNPEVSGAYYATIESKHGHVRSDSCSYDALEDKWDLYHIPGYTDYYVTHYLVPLDTNI